MWFPKWVWCGLVSKKELPFLKPLIMVIFHKSQCSSGCVIAILHKFQCSSGCVIVILHKCQCNSGRVIVILEYMSFRIHVL